MWVIWNKKKYRITSIMDEFPRCEVDASLPTEAAAEGRKILEERWINWAGAPKVLRLDMSGPHTSGEFREWANKWNIKLDFIPKESHHMLRIIERNHA